MSNLFLMSSDHDRDQLGEGIVDLDKVVLIRLSKNLNQSDDGVIFGIFIESEHVGMKCWFKTEEACRDRLKEIITAMVGDTAMANDIIVHDSTKSEMAKRNIKKAIESL